MIVVEGSGPVALACALFLHRRGVAAQQLSVSINDGALPAAVANRTLAVSLGSWQLLSRIITLPAAAAIEQIEVSLAGHAGKTRISAADMKQVALGYVLDYQSLQQALNQAAHAAAMGQRETSGQAISLRINAQGEPGDQASERQFNQHAILVRLSCPQLPHHCAYERFTREGPLALLPLPQGGGFALVWCGLPHQSSRRMEQGEAQFIDELVQHAGPRLLGAVLLSQRHSAPLSRRSRSTIVEGSQVWIGNAAQSLHPVAGQGLNLGLRDAFELARAVAQPQSIAQALQTFAQVRSADRNRTISITDTLASIFSVPALMPIESIAMALLDAAAVPRRLLASSLMFGNR